MGICELLTIIFVLCKLFGHGAVAAWSWFQVLLPEIIAVVIYVAISAVVLIISIHTARKENE